MQSTNTRMSVPGMANNDDGTCWETVLRFLSTPTPADYSFDFDGRFVHNLYITSLNLGVVANTCIS
jgi:hypothetical protein